MVCYGSIKVIKRKAEKLIVQNKSSIPLMSVTNACSECYMVKNAFGDINYSDEKQSKKE